MGSILVRDSFCIGTHCTQLLYCICAVEVCALLSFPCLRKGGGDIKGCCIVCAYIKTNDTALWKCLPEVLHRHLTLVEPGVNEVG